MSWSGAEANGVSSESTISADGRYVFFKSTATNLIDGQTNSGTWLYRHDRTTGATVKIPIGKVGRFSASSDGAQVAVDSGDFGLLGGDADPAYTFDGYTDAVQLPSGFANFTGGLTFEAWVNPTTASNLVGSSSLAAAGRTTTHACPAAERRTRCRFRRLQRTTKVGQVGPRPTRASQLVATRCCDDQSYRDTATIYRNGAPVATGTTAVPRTSRAP